LVVCRIAGVCVAELNATAHPTPLLMNEIAETEPSAAGNGRARQV
jgi:hypothetical protein